MYCDTNDSRIPSELLFEMYKDMMKIRLFEERVGCLVLKKEIVTPCHLYVGQEAVATGVCSALRKDDYVFGTHRSHGHYIAKGGDLNALMAELYGKAAGCSKGWGGSMHLISIDTGFAGSSAIVGGSISLAVGAGLAFSLQNQRRISVAFFGDGATNEGVFYESLNFAALNKLPVLFICENNLYSSHMPISRCLANTDIYRKAEAFNLPGVRVDGNDVIKVYEAAKEAIQNARSGKGPTLIECLTYRWRGHVGPNDDLEKGLRSKSELDQWMKRCPIKLLEKRLVKQGAFKERKRKIQLEIEQQLDRALDFAKSSRYPDTKGLPQNSLLKLGSVAALSQNQVIFGD